MHHSPAQHRQQRLRALDALQRHGHQVLVQHREVGELAGLEGAAVLLVEAEPGAVDGVVAQRLFAAGCLLRRSQLQAADRAPSASR